MFGVPAIWQGGRKVEFHCRPSVQLQIQFFRRDLHRSDVVEGVIDDAVRRMLVPLPNAKSFSACKSQTIGIVKL